MCHSARRSHLHETAGAEGGAPETRASDADRERTITLLREHAAHGRLTIDELEERIERAHAARTIGELRALRADLPRISPARDERQDGHGDAVRHYLAVMALLVAIWALTGAGYFWPVWPMLGWGLAIAPHMWPAKAARRRAVT